MTNTQTTTGHATQEGEFGLGSVIEDGTSHPVVLGQKKSHGSSFTTAVRAGSNVLVPRANAAPAGQFEIHAQSGPAAGSQELIGIGKRGDDGSVVPVMALQATPSFSYGIAPQAQFYMARFENGIRVGELVDLRASWKKAAIDFSIPAAKSHTQVVVRALSSGRFEVSYRSPTVRRSSLSLRLVTAAASHPIGNSAASHPISSPSIGALARHGRDRWSGNISWPDTAATAAVIQGSGMVIDALGSKYGWSVNTTQTGVGGVSMKVSFWLRDEACRQPDYLYEEDWKKAVVGLQTDDGLMDLGCFPNTPYGSFSRLPVASR